MDDDRLAVKPRSGNAMAARERTPEQVVAEYLDAFGRHDVEALGRMCTDDIVELLAGIPPLEGIDSELGFARELFAAFPDMEVEVTRLMAVDQVVAAAWTRRGTFSGADFQGLPSNGARFESPAAGFFEIENGLVKRVTVYFDMNKFARDLGLAPAEGSLAERLAMGMFRARVRTKRLFGAGRGRKQGI
jgi:limonene-1,2-epoxide hydrolase